MTITIDEAIEVVWDLLKTSSREKSPKSWDALKIAYEALKRVQLQRKQNDHTLLPGEKEE